MKWLTIEYIKLHSRIDYDCEDAVLELYGNSAEQTIMELLRRDYDDIVENFGTDEQPIPADLIHAALMLVDASYQYRTPVSSQNLSIVGYAFDMKIKPYMRLAGGSVGDDMRNKYVYSLLQQKQLLDYKCEGVEDDTLKGIYSQIDTYTRKWMKINDPSQQILADMKVQTEQIEHEVEEYLNHIND